MTELYLTLIICAACLIINIAYTRFVLSQTKISKTATTTNANVVTYISTSKSKPASVNILDDVELKQLLAECADARIEYMRSSEGVSCWLYGNNISGIAINRSDILAFLKKNNILYAISDYYLTYNKYLIIVHLKGNGSHSTNIKLELPLIKNSNDSDAIRLLLNSGRLIIKPIQFHSVGTNYKVIGEYITRLI